MWHYGFVFDATPHVALALLPKASTRDTMYRDGCQSWHEGTRVQTRRSALDLIKLCFADRTPVSHKTERAARLEQRAAP